MIEPLGRHQFLKSEKVIIAQKAVLQAQLPIVIIAC